MRPRDLNPMIREALGVHAMFFQMGFTPDEVYMGVQGHAICRKPHLFIVLRAQDKEFNYDVGHLDLEATSKEEWEEQIKKAYNVWNESSQYERDWVFNRCIVRKDTVMLLSSVVNKGIIPPRSTDESELL